MEPLPLTETSILRPWVRYLINAGAPVERYLERAHLSPELLYLTDRRITKSQYFQFLDVAINQSGIFDLGFQVGAGFGPRDMGRLGQLIRSGSTLGDSLDWLIQYTRSFIGGNRIWMVRKKDTIWLCSQGTDQIPFDRELRHQANALVLTNIIRLAAGETWNPSEMIVPPISDRTREQLPTLGHANLRSRLDYAATAFPSWFLARPLKDPLPRPDLPRDFLETYEGVQAPLIRTLRDQLPYLDELSLDLAAEICGTSARTLQRRLEDEGASFRRVRDRVRFEAAREFFIEDPDAKIFEIASAVGYTNANNFSRAFHRFTGMSPTAFANAISEEGKPLAEPSADESP